MNTRRRFASLLSLPVLLALAAPAAAQTTIDDFNTNMPALLSAPPQQSSNTNGAGILGSNRGVLLNNIAGTGPTTVNVTGGNLVLTVTATNPDSRGETRLQWDSDTDPLVLGTGGFNPGVDLTTGNTRGFQIGFASSTVAAEIEITVWDDNVAANSSRAVRRVPAGGSQLVRIPFTEFRTFGPGPANFADVRAIELTVRAGEGSVSINDFVTSTPSLAATKVDAQIIDNDSDTRVDPGDRVRYTVTITNTGNQATSVDLTDTVDANTTLVASSTSSTPIARNDQYGWFGNATLVADGVTAHPLLLANDADPDGDDVDVQSVVSPTAAGGTVTIDDAETGEFTYSPPPGFKGVDSFNYTIVDDDAHTSIATANIQLQGVVWFVDNTNTTPPQIGTQTDPFVSLPQAEAVAGDGDIVYVRTGSGNYDTGTTDGYTMSLNQQLIGEGVALVLSGTTIFPAGTPPVLANADGRGITLGAASIRTIRGLTIGATQTAKIFGSTFGTLNTDTVALSGAGQALDLTTGVLAATFTGIGSTNSAGRGINLDAATGTLTVTGSTAISDSALAGIRVINGGSTYGFGATTLSSINTGAGIDFATNSTSTFNFTSLSITTDAGPGLVAGTSGTINIGGTGNTIVATGGPALDITSTSLGTGATFATVSSSGSPGKGINLDTVTGALTMNGGAITTAAGIDFDLNAGASTVTYAGSITNTASRSVEITGRTGGTVTLSGNINDTGTGINVANNNASGSPIINFSGASKIVNTGTNPAVTLDNNDVATINFTGGNLDIDTTSGTAFNAINGAVAITVQGTGNTIVANGSGSALQVANSTIGSLGMNFQSISAGTAAGSAGVGISLDSTCGGNCTLGTVGGLTVTGTGAAASGGTIQHKTGADGSVTAGVGIYLNNTKSASFNRMQLNDFDNFAIRGTNVRGFTFDNSAISGTSGSAAGAFDEAAISINELTGSASISNSTISHGFEYILKVLNSSGVLDRLTVDNTDFGVNNTGLGGDAVQLVASQTATLNATVVNSGFVNAREDLFNAAVTQSANMDLVFTNNTLSNNHTNKVSAASNLLLFSTSNGTVTYNMSNNVLSTGATGSAIAAAKGVPDTGSGGTMSGTIGGNAIGLAGVVGSGSEFTGIFVSALGSGTHTTAVSNNIVRHYNEEGIFLKSNDPLTGGNAVLNATVTGNQTLEPDSFAFAGLWIVAGSGSGAESHAVNVVLGSFGTAALQNDFTAGDPANGSDVFLQEAGSASVINLSRAGSAAGTVAAVIADDNVGTPTVVSSGTVNLVNTLPPIP